MNVPISWRVFTPVECHQRNFWKTSWSCRPIESTKNKFHCNRLATKALSPKGNSKGSWAWGPGFDLPLEGGFNDSRCGNSELRSQDRMMSLRADTFYIFRLSRRRLPYSEFCLLTSVFFSALFIKRPVRLIFFFCAFVSQWLNLRQKSRNLPLFNPNTSSSHWSIYNRRHPWGVLYGIRFMFTHTRYLFYADL